MLCLARYEIHAPLLMIYRDAGIVLSSYLYGLKNGFERTQPAELSVLKRILNRPKARILELGAGCGIIGLTLATCFDGAEVIMTDLPQAEEIAKYNISKNVGKTVRYSYAYWQ